MNKLLNAFKPKSASSQFLELVIGMVEKQKLSSIKKVTGNDYTFGEGTVSVKYFDPDCFDEMQISFGYSLGKGVTVILRHYGEHLVVINHEILEQYYTIEHPIPPDTFVLADYFKRLDKVATGIMTTIEGLADA